MSSAKERKRVILYELGVYILDHGQTCGPIAKRTVLHRKTFIQANPNSKFMQNFMDHVLNITSFQQTSFRNLKSRWIPAISLFLGYVSACEIMALRNTTRLKRFESSRAGISCQTVYQSSKVDWFRVISLCWFV